MWAALQSTNTTRSGCITGLARSLGTQDSGMQGAAGNDAKGKPISALGHPRPYGQINGCCMPAPSILVFNPAGKLLKSWGGPGDPDFLKTKCREG